MYEDEYYYEARKKENAKLDAELAGTFATVIGGLIGAVLSCLLFLLRRFDVLSSGLASLLFYMLTYQVIAKLAMLVRKLESKQKQN